MYPDSIGWGFSARGHRPSTASVGKLAPRSGSPLTRPRGWWGFGDPSRSSSIGTGVCKPCRSWGRRCAISWSSLTLLLQKGFGGSETALRGWDSMVPSDFGPITLEWSRGTLLFFVLTQNTFKRSARLPLHYETGKQILNHELFVVHFLGEPKSASAKQIWPWHKSLPRRGFTCRAVSWRYDQRIVGNNYLVPPGTQTWHWKKHHV